MCTCCVLYYNWQNIFIARNAVLLHIHTHGEQKLTVVVELTEEEKEKDEERKRRKALERQRVEDRERELKRLDAERKKEEAVRLRESAIPNQRRAQLSRLKRFCPKFRLQVMYKDNLINNYLSLISTFDITTATFSRSQNS